MLFCSNGTDGRREVFARRHPEHSLGGPLAGWPPPLSCHDDSNQYTDNDNCNIHILIYIYIHTHTNYSKVSVRTLVYPTGYLSLLKPRGVMVNVSLPEKDAMQGSRSYLYTSNTAQVNNSKQTISNYCNLPPPNRNPPL